MTDTNGEPSPPRVVGLRRNNVVIFHQLMLSSDTMEIALTQVPREKFPVPDSLLNEWTPWRWAAVEAPVAEPTGSRTTISTAAGRSSPAPMSLGHDHAC